MDKDPLDAVFETPEQSLAIYLNSMPKSLKSVFQREFMRRPKELPFTETSDIEPDADSARFHGQEAAV